MCLLILDLYRNNPAEREQLTMTHLEYHVSRRFDLDELLQLLLHAPHHFRPHVHEPDLVRLPNDEGEVGDGLRDGKADLAEVVLRLQVLHGVGVVRQWPETVSSLMTAPPLAV